MFDSKFHTMNHCVYISHFCQDTISKFQVEFIYLFIYLFSIFGCIGSSLLHAGFLQLWRAGATLRCSERASHSGGFSCCGSTDTCARAQLLRSVWDLPLPGLEPVSPVLEGGFLTTEPQGKCPGGIFASQILVRTISVMEFPVQLFLFPPAQLWDKRPPLLDLDLDPSSSPSVNRAFRALNHSVVFLPCFGPTERRVTLSEFCIYPLACKQCDCH